MEPHIFTPLLDMNAKIFHPIAPLPEVIDFSVMPSAEDVAGGWLVQTAAPLVDDVVVPPPKPTKKVALDWTTKRTEFDNMSMLQFGLRAQELRQTKRAEVAYEAIAQAWFARHGEQMPGLTIERVSVALRRARQKARAAAQ